MTATASPTTLLEVTTRGSLVTGTEVTLTSRQFSYTIDEPPAPGGTDKGANPVEHLLAALASCTVISYRVWADKLGLTVDTIDVDLRGDLDLAGFLGTDDSVRPGFPGHRAGH
uniref:OsmC family protein n=1 Tax=Janibacter limosus TaxID=53458 RepID=A0AC61U3P0_9MICO|nr:OsmC family protein [Janibacter limosus]